MITWISLTKYDHQIWPDVKFKKTKVYKVYQGIHAGEKWQNQAKNCQNMETQKNLNYDQKWPKLSKYHHRPGNV